MGTTAVPRCPHSFLSRISPPEIHFTGSIPALLPGIGQSTYLDMLSSNTRGTCARDFTSEHCSSHSGWQRGGSEASPWDQSQTKVRGSEMNVLVKTEARSAMRDFLIVAADAFFSRFFFFKFDHVCTLGYAATLGAPHASDICAQLIRLSLT